MRDASQDARLVEAVQVLEDQPELPEQSRVLEPGEGRIELRHEQRVIGRQGRDEGRIQGEVVLGRVAGPAGPSVATEGLVEEDRLSPGNNNVAPGMRA